MRRERAAGFADEMRMIDARLVADFHDLENHVVRVLLHRIIHRRVEISLAAVVIDSEPAADIEIFEAGAKFRELDKKSRGFFERGFDIADRADLAADVKMQKLKAVEHAA